LSNWRLCPGTAEDARSLHALACEKPVYRFLFDGTPPEMGMWMLQDGSAQCLGCVELRPYPLARSAELTYLLHPDCWGRGLATRMAWSAITLAFASPRIDCVIAGHDLPNTASLAVMRRLGMRYHRSVRYPLGAGAEYVLHRDDPGPMPRPVPIPIG